MSKRAKTCQAKTWEWDKACGRDLYDSQHCIFHSKRPEKDAKLFQQRLDEIFENESFEICDFSHFVFPKGISFPKEIGKEVYFGWACFEDHVSFSNITFQKPVRFYQADFRGFTSFTHATFQDLADFGAASFKGETFFSRAVFESKANLWSAVFHDKASFVATRFKAEALFWVVTFRDEVSFCVATFEDVLEITGGLTKTRLSHKEADFRRVALLKPEKVTFKKVDLSKCRFLETDVRKVEFADVDWDRKEGRNRTYDEIEPDPGYERFEYRLIAQVYKRLRANYQESLRYSEAGDFYIGEMEMTRKAERNVFKKLPLLLYKGISNYGESYYRPLCWIAVMLLLFPLLFMVAGIQPVSLDPNRPTADTINYRLDFSSSESLLPTGGKLGHYHTSFLYTMSVFSFIRDKKYTTIDSWGHTLFVLESILSPVTLAFFLLALRRRFKR